MKLLVFVKQVIDTGFQFRIDRETFEPDPDDIFYILNPADRDAIEIAVKLKDSLKGELCAVSIGPKRVDRVLQDCLALGCDHAFRIWDKPLEEISYDPARILALAGRKLKPDLILCGDFSLDRNCGEVPSIAAERLDFPQVTAVTGVAIGDANDLIVERKLEGGIRQRLSCPLPVLLAIHSGVTSKRKPGLPQYFIARGTVPEVMDFSSLGIENDHRQILDPQKYLVKRSFPRPRPKKVYEFDKNISAEDRMEAMMSGGLKQKRSNKIEGPSDEVSNKVAVILENHIEKMG